MRMTRMKGCVGDEVEVDEKRFAHEPDNGPNAELDGQLIPQLRNYSNL